MNKRSGAINVIKRIMPAVVLAVAAALIFLYALGYYDFTFIERPQRNERPVENTVTDNTTENAESASPDETAAPPPETDFDPPVKVPDPDNETVIDPSAFPDAGDAGADGYFLTSMPYTSDMVIAELRVRLEETDDYSLRTRSWDKPHNEYENENGEAKVVWTPTEEDMPALEAYMGNIFADTGDTVYVYDSFGRYIGTFNPDYYEFAYKRDAGGNPLFRQPYTYTVSTKDGDQTETFRDYYYYVMGASGGMYDSDYNDATENRGLMADYPAYYGAFDSDLGRSCKYSRVIQKDLKGRLDSFIRTRWSFTLNGEPINDTVYYAAYPFSEGYSCVTDEEGIMYFADRYGNKTFDTKSEYWSIGNRMVVDRLLLPDDETTALGCYYYDHGLVKARRQIYDYYQLEDWDLMFVMSDDYVMLYGDGTEFPVPADYNVKTYSDGVILLEKNGVYGYMDYTGAWLSIPEYEDALPFMEGLAACRKNGRWGMIDTAGNTVIPFLYDHIQSASSGVIICHSEVGWNTYLKMSKDA